MLMTLRLQQKNTMFHSFLTFSLCIFGRGKAEKKYQHL